MHSIRLTHTTQTGHRIPGHEGGTGKCARLHGHTYRYEVELGARVLEGGFVVDFADVKRILDVWDHRTLLHVNDPFLVAGQQAVQGLLQYADEVSGIVRVPFVPTAENMAEHLANMLLSTFDNLIVVRLDLYETENTSASFTCSRNLSSASRPEVLAASLA